MKIGRKIFLKKRDSVIPGSKRKMVKLLYLSSLLYYLEGTRIRLVPVPVVFPRLDSFLPYPRLKKKSEILTKTDAKLVLNRTRM